MLLRYLGDPAVVVRGPFTQRAYAFTALRPVQMVETRDAVSLLRTRLFRQA